MPARNPFATILNPASIAVVGASRSPQKVGYQILKNLIDNGYRGRLYPVNPNADTILKLRTFPTINDIKKPVDLCIIVTPAPIVSTIIAECHQNKVNHSIIISAGFGESGAKGALLQQELTHSLIRYPVNTLGPNCLGVLSPIHHLNATFGPKLPQPGRMMLISQSGALVTGIIDWAQKMDVGLSHAVTFGNRVGIGEIEALEFARDDPHTQAVLVYLESFQNAPRFFSTCSTLTPKKPVIVLKGGQSLAGQTASASHTAALASSYVLTRAFAQQAGVIICNTIQEWLNLAAAFAHVPKAQSTHVTIVTNAGGPGVLSTDEAVGLGLSLPELNPALKQKLHAVLPRINPHNPLDILGDATPEDFSAALTVLKHNSHVGNQLIIITPQTTTKPLATAESIVATKTHQFVPTYACLIGGDKMKPARDVLNKHHILNFEFPTNALQIIAAKSHYETTKDSIFMYPAEKPGFVGIKKKNHLKHLLEEDICLKNAFTLLTAYGFRLPKSAIVNNVEEIAAAVNFVGRPAVAKTAGMAILHKAAVGGVCLNLMTVAAARTAYRKLRVLYPEVLFQQTIFGQVELILGAKRDTQLGPFITVGLGGSLTNTLEDRAYAFIPASKSYLKKIFSQTKASRLLLQHHLSPDPVIDALERLSAVLLDYDNVSELEINPCILTPQTLYAADIKITLF